MRQDVGTKAYDLGQFAIELGVSALGRSNFLAAAHESQRDLRDHLDEFCHDCRVGQSWSGHYVG